MNMPYGESSWFDYTVPGMIYNYFFPDEVTPDDIQFGPPVGRSSIPLEPRSGNGSGNGSDNGRGREELPTRPAPGAWVGPVVFGVSLLVLVGVLARRPGRGRRRGRRK